MASVLLRFTSKVFFQNFFRFKNFFRFRRIYKNQDQTIEIKAILLKSGHIHKIQDHAVKIRANPRNPDQTAEIMVNLLEIHDQYIEILTNP